MGRRPFPERRGATLRKMSRRLTMKLKANDTLLISSIKSDNILPGETFEVSDERGRDLVDRGLATEVKPTAKKAAAPKNKMATPPANKAGGRRRAK
jgi:hypothetical protein